MEDFRRRGILKWCDYYSRGMFTAEQTCKTILFTYVEPKFIPEYMLLLPADLLSALALYLPKLPSTDEDWVGYEGMAQLDGNEYTWAAGIAEWRSATDAARVYLLGSAPTDVGVDFLDRVRSAYLSRFAEWTRTRKP